MSQSNQEAQDNMCRAIYAAIRRHFNHIIQDGTGQIMLDVAALVDNADEWPYRGTLNELPW